VPRVKKVTEHRTKEHPNCPVRELVTKSNVCGTGNTRTYDLIGFGRAVVNRTVVNRAVVNRTLISRRRNVINGGSVPGITFHTLNIPKFTTEMEKEN
jgi:hypothetical protein